jgi:hypothetical protein
MAQREPDAIHRDAIALTTKAGIHVFTRRDRLWVEGKSRPVTDVCPGDLVAFLGRVLSVHRVSETALPEAPAPQLGHDLAA